MALDRQLAADRPGDGFELAVAGDRQDRQALAVVAFDPA